MCIVGHLLVDLLREDRLLYSRLTPNQRSIFYKSKSHISHPRNIEKVFSFAALKHESALNYTYIFFATACFGKRSSSLTEGLVVSIAVVDFSKYFIPISHLSELFLVRQSVPQPQLWRFVWYFWIVCNLYFKILSFKLNVWVWKYKYLGFET